VVQGKGPEFKDQYCKKKKKRNRRAEGTAQVVEHLLACERPWVESGRGGGKGGGEGGGGPLSSTMFWGHLPSLSR
jgi:hypothetical protein